LVTSQYYTFKYILKMFIKISMNLEACALKLSSASEFNNRLRLHSLYSNRLLFFFIQFDNWILWNVIICLNDCVKNRYHQLKIMKTKIDWLVESKLIQQTKYDFIYKIRKASVELTKYLFFCALKMKLLNFKYFVIAYSLRYQ
jgi:hypothetical protein